MNNLKVYTSLSRLPFPKSYLGKILLIAFLGTHIPLLALVLYLLFSSPLGLSSTVGILIIVLVATLLGTTATLYVLYALLKPVSLASRALADYLDYKRLPHLPLGFTDQAGKLMANVRYVIEHLDETIGSLEELSTKDYLTGAYNRRACEERLLTHLARVSRSASTLTVVLADLDQFKSVNDRYGHQAGDACLKHVANIIRRNIREGDWLARWGGDEFMLGLCGTEEEQPAKAALERIAKELAESPVQLPQGDEIRLTLSGGSCRFTGNEEAVRSTQGVFACVDEALHQAKREGDTGTFIYVNDDS